MKALALLLVSALLSACGTTSSTRLHVTPVSNTSFKLLDERPFEERLSTKKETGYGSADSILGDDAIEPPPPMLFRIWLQREMAKELSGASVSLKRFKVLVYEPPVQVDEQQFGTAASSVPGANGLSTGLARLLVQGIESARSEKIVRVQIDADIDVRDVSAIETGTFRGRVTEDDIGSVIREALNSFVKSARTGK